MMLAPLAFVGLSTSAIFLGCGSDAGDESGPEHLPVDAAAEAKLYLDAESDAQVGAEASVDAGTDVTGDAPDDAPDGGVDAGSCTTQETLLDHTGQSFAPTSALGFEKYKFGLKGTAYCSLRIQLDLDAGDLQPVDTVSGMTRIEHIFFGLSRANQAQSANRYLMGTAAVRFTNKSPSLKMYGRIDLAQGWQSYTSWQASYAWKAGDQYHVDCTFDAAQHEQRCKLLKAGVLQKQVVGAIPYVQVSDMATAFEIELGSQPGGPELTAPFGWKLSNLVVTATR